MLELIIVFAAILWGVSSVSVFLGPEITQKRIYFAFGTAFLGGFILVFALSVIAGLKPISSLIYATISGVIAAGMFVGIGYISRKQRDWVIKNLQNQLQKQYLKKSGKGTLADIPALLCRYQSRDIKLYDLVSELEVKNNLVKEQLSIEDTKTWNEYLRNLEIASAEISYGEIPEEEILEFADEQVRLFLEVVERNNKQSLESNQT